MPSSTSLRTLVSAGCAVAVTASLTTMTSLTSPATGSTTAPASSQVGSGGDDGRAPGTGTASQPRQTSDGVAGEIAPPQPAGRVTVVRRNQVGWSMAPGIDYTTWEQVDGIRKPIRAHLITVDIVSPYNSFDLISTTKVAATNPLSWMAEKSGAIAAVNGDFFDITDTGAPLGVGISRREGLRHAPAAGWNNSFWVDKGGRPHVGELPFTGAFRRGKHPKITFSNYNSPTVAPHGIGVYTPTWGRTMGTRVVDGQKKVRQVIIKRGRVVSNTYGLSSGRKIRGKMLIGRGRGAGLLKNLKRGERLQLKWRVTGKPAMAISGDRPLLVNGQRVVINNAIMHPRTAVGIDEDGNRVFLLLIDGRSTVSRGYTMVELANMMLALGAENALNLDGGGSSTMIGHTDPGVLSVLNTPSDGQQRPVPNGLAVFNNPIS